MGDMNHGGARESLRSPARLLPGIWKFASLIPHGMAVRRRKICRELPGGNKFHGVPTRCAAWVYTNKVHGTLMGLAREAGG
jgi:hypothetical protein